MVAFIMCDVLLIHVEFIGISMYVIEVWRQTVQNVHIKSWVCMGLLEKKVLKSGLKQGNTSFFQKVESRKLYVFHIHLVYLLDKKIFGYKRRCVILLRRWYQKM